MMVCGSDLPVDCCLACGADGERCCAGNACNAGLSCCTDTNNPDCDFMGGIAHCTQPSPTPTETPTVTPTTTPTASPTNTPPPPGCRITGGVVSSVGTLLSDVEITKGTGGGQVGAPCACIGCFDQFDQIQGNWQYSEKKRGISIKATDFNSLVCGCESCSSSGQFQASLDGQFCNANDLQCGPGKPNAPANIGCFSGVGNYSPNPGKKSTMVAFRVNVEDRGEPGSGQNASCTGLGVPLTCCTGSGTGNCDDVYRIQIYVPSGGADNAKALAAAACCTDNGIVKHCVGGSNPGALCSTNGGQCLGGGTCTGTVRAPNVDDGGPLIHGNIQIHPQTPPSGGGICPLPNGSCQ